MSSSVFFAQEERRCLDSSGNSIQEARQKCPIRWLSAIQTSLLLPFLHPQMMEMCLDTHPLGIQYGQWGLCHGFLGLPKGGAKLCQNPGSQNASGLGCFKFSHTGPILVPLESDGIFEKRCNFHGDYATSNKNAWDPPTRQKKDPPGALEISWCETRSGRSSSTNTVSFSKKEID